MMETSIKKDLLGNLFYLNRNLYPLCKVKITQEYIYIYNCPLLKNVFYKMYNTNQTEK